MAVKNYKISGRFYDTVLHIVDWEKEKRRIGESHDDWRRQWIGSPTSIFL